MTHPINIINDPDLSWLNGKYANGNEINTLLPYVAYNEFFAQSDEADRIISEIHAIWLKGDKDQQQAFDFWAGLHL